MKPTIVETYPPAKLNLFLELLGKRSDGFHELETVMVAVDRCDRLRVARTRSPDVALNCRWSPSAAAWQQRVPSATAGAFELPPPEQNLVVRALQRFREAFEIEGGFCATLEKCIPAGAGMGGASSDAASALLAAASLAGISTTDPRIEQIAAELGSDIPFFLNLAAVRSPASGRRCGAALARGRGERLEALESAPQWHIVVVHPPEPLSTAEVYRHCHVPRSPRRAGEFLAEYGKNGGRGGFGGKAVEGLFNRLSEPSRQMSPWIDRALEALRGVGLRGATMTGSGSACFAIARSARSARRAAAMLSSRRIGVSFATTPTSLPAAIRILT